MKGDFVRMWERYIQLKPPKLKIKKYFDFRTNENVNYENCPICSSISYKEPNHESFIEVRCIRCGVFRVSENVYDYILEIKEMGRM
ncbi:MAG: hypothetical protein ABDH21_06720 [bacterium]